MKDGGRIIVKLFPGNINGKHLLLERVGIFRINNYFSWSSKMRKRKKLNRGARHERLVLGLIRSMRLPWVSKTRLATRQEDHEGADIIIEDIWGQTMFLQVKSSKREARRFRKLRRDKNKPNIITVVVDSNKYSRLQNLDHIKQKFEWNPIEVPNEN